MWLKPRRVLTELGQKGCFHKVNQGWLHEVHSSHVRWNMKNDDVISAFQSQTMKHLKSFCKACAISRIAELKKKNKQPNLPSVLSNKHLRASWHSGGWPQWFGRLSIICSKSQSAEPRLVLLNFFSDCALLCVFRCCFLHPLAVCLSRILKEGARDSNECRNVHGDASLCTVADPAVSHTDRQKDSNLGQVLVFQVKNSQHNADADSVLLSQYSSYFSLLSRSQFVFQVNTLPLLILDL